MHTCTATCSSSVLMGPTGSCFNSVDNNSNFNKERTGRTWNQGRLTKHQQHKQPLQRHHAIDRGGDRGPREDQPHRRDDRGPAVKGRDHCLRAA